MTFICSDRESEARVEEMLKDYGLTEEHGLLKTGPSETDPTVYLSIQGEVPVELREELRAQLSSMPGITIQESM